MSDGWRAATVVAIRKETATARTLELDVPGWPGHVAGQHVKVRLSPGEEDRTERSFSIASPPEQSTLELTIERLPAGRVSGRLCGDVDVGYRFEVNGPRGDFVWRARDGGPLLLIAGGSGVVPLMAMLRHREAARRNGGEWPGRIGRAQLLYSSQNWDRVIYRDELARLARSDSTLSVTHTLTREVPVGWEGRRPRIDRDLLRTLAWAPAEAPRIYVCGPTAMVEEMAGALASLGHDPSLIFTERFGPTGGKSRAA